MSKKHSQQEQIIAQYAACPASLSRAVRGLTKSELDLFETPGSWTIRQYVHHVADGDEIWKVFIKRALGGSGGKFDLAWYTQVSEQDYWARAWMYAQRRIAPSLALFRANRANTVQLLRQIPGSLEKCLVYCFRDGREEMVSVREIVEMQTQHVEGHIEDIERILSARQT